MKSHRIIIYIGAVLAVAVALPGSALASPLLSGYGGPGQGNQALLGSALVNGPKGGGGSSGSASSTDAGIAESETSSEGQASGGGSGPSKGGGNGSSKGGTTSSSARHAGNGSGATNTARGKSSTAAAAPSFYPAAERLPADSQGGSLGLSATDVLLIVVAAALLVSLGLLTRRAGGSGERESTGG